MNCIRKVILRKTMRTTINFYLVNLSAADLLSTLWCPLHRCFFLTVVVNCLRHFQGKLLKYCTQHVDISLSILLTQVLNTLNFTNFFNSVCWLSWLRSICCRRYFARSPLSTPSSALSLLWAFFVIVFLCLFSCPCPGQLNRWPRHSLTQ